MRMLKPEFIPRILLSLILFSLGSLFLLFAAPSCICPLLLVGQPLPPPPVYPVWELMLVVSLIGAGIMVLVLPSDRPIKRTEISTSSDPSSDSSLQISAGEKDLAG